MLLPPRSVMVVFFEEEEESLEEEEKEEEEEEEEYAPLDSLGRRRFRPILLSLTCCAALCRLGAWGVGWWWRREIWVHLVTISEMLVPPGEMQAKPVDHYFWTKSIPTSTVGFAEKCD